MKIIVFATILLAMTGCASTSRTKPGETLAEFKIAGGDVVQHPMRAGMPLPAESRHYRMNVAGIIAKDGTLIWSFGFAAKNVAVPTRVTVEQVYPNSQSIEIVSDNNPALRNGGWIGQSKPVAIDQTALPWLYESGESTFVFRVTAEVNGELPDVMLQPSIINDRAKQIYRSVAK